MLYQTIVSKSFQLEDDLVNGKLKKETVILFIDLLNRAIPKLYSASNYNKTVSLLLKWKTISYDYFDLIPSSIINTRYEHSGVTDQLIEEQVPISIDIEKLAAVFSNEKSNIDFDDIKLDKDDNAYRNSELIESWNNANDIIRDTSKIEASSIGSKFYMSWALHTKGNILSAHEHYKPAYVYYDRAMKIKYKLKKVYDASPDANQAEKGAVYFSYYQTYIKKSILSLNFREKYFGKDLIDGINSVREEIDENKKILDSANKDYYELLINAIYYCRWKIYLYDKGLDDNTGIQILEKNERLSEKLKDYPAQIRAKIYQYAFSPVVADEIIYDIGCLLEIMSQKYKNSPVLKALIGPKHIVEYNIAKNSNSFGEKLVEVFKRYDIYPHPSNDISKLLSKEIYAG